MRAFSSAQAFLDSNALQDISCLITDIGMPGMDGFELQRVVSERRADFPVILISGRHEFSHQMHPKGGWFFRKPFDGQSLLAAISDALTRKRGVQNE